MLEAKQVRGTLQPCFSYVLAASGPSWLTCGRRPGGLVLRPQNTLPSPAAQWCLVGKLLRRLAASINVLLPSASCCAFQVRSQSK